MNTASPLMDVTQLVAADNDHLLLVDCRFELADPDAGRRAYCQAHIPGAVHASLDQDLSDMSRQGLGRHPLPQPQVFAATLARWGWRPGMTVVAYDAGSGAMAAARLWWLVRWLGYSACVLDGGLKAWRAAGQAVVDGEQTRQPAQIVAAAPDAASVMDTQTLRALLAADEITLLDARAAARYRGDSEPVDPVAGHVPGARNRPFADNLVDGLHWRDAATLEAAFRQLIGDRDPVNVVHMCGSGVTACHNVLAMEQAGLHGSRLYAPSWSGWISDPDFVAEKHARVRSR